MLTYRISGADARCIRPAVPYVHFYSYCAMEPTTQENEEKKENNSSERPITLRDLKTIFLVSIVAIILLMVGFFVPFSPFKSQFQTEGFRFGDFSGLTALATYRNDEYRFEIRYPSSITPETSFAPFYPLSGAWRAEASAESRGRPIIAFPILRIDQGVSAEQRKFYPLYFITEVRIGVSNDMKDVEECLKPDPGYTEQKITDEILNGTLFKRFEFGNAAMMQYVQGVSWRTVRNGACIAIEQVKAGSTYRDGSMTRGLTDAELDLYYEEAEAIIQTFRFTDTSPS